VTDHSLIDVDDSVLVVIDVQKAFLDKVGRAAGNPLTERIAWLIEVANWLGVPLVVTAEDVDRLGGPVKRVAEALPAGTAVHNKMVFGLAGQPDILAAVEATGRRTAVVVGLETDVCVAQSAVGLLERGFRVVVPVDCVGTPGTAHAFGLERMRAAGAVMTGAKPLLYEWVRTVERSIAFHTELSPKLGIPPDIVV
jgi:nicotinamidase-related amidase